MYVIAVISRKKREFMGLGAFWNKSAQTMETLVQPYPSADIYFGDGNPTFKIMDFYPGRFKQSHRKDDTYTVEGSYADLRHFIPRLRRQSRCFYRKIETLNAVLNLLAYGYNRFSQWKHHNQIPVKHKSPFPNPKLRRFRYPKLSHLGFIHVH